MNEGPRCWATPGVRDLLLLVLKTACSHPSTRVGRFTWLTVSWHLQKHYNPLIRLCKGNAGDVLLLHPHLAHSSTTNVRFGRDVRLALTKRAYWTTGMEIHLASVNTMRWLLFVDVCWCLWQCVAIWREHLIIPLSISVTFCTGPATTSDSLMPVEFPLSWAATKRTRC